MTAMETRHGAAAAQITESAIASFDHCPDPRLRQILQALVRHLHAFASEVNLTEAEWMRGIKFLTTTGHLTDDKRQEFILWSDVLGVSMLVDAMNHPSIGDATESTVLGPFWTPGAPSRAYGESLFEQESGGTPALVRGVIRDTHGLPIAGAELDIWQNGPDGLYTVQNPEAPEAHLRGRYLSRKDGSYAFVGVRPIPYTVPHDGPVGGMLDAAERHPWRPAHIHMIVTAPGYQRLQTHIFDSESAYLDSDVVFAVKPALIRQFAVRSADHPETPAGVSGTWCLVENDLVLQPVA